MSNQEQAIAVKKALDLSVKISETEKSLKKIIWLSRRKARNEKPEGGT